MCSSHYLWVAKYNLACIVGGLIILISFCKGWAASGSFRQREGKNKEKRRGKEEEKKGEKKANPDWSAGQDA